METNLPETYDDKKEIEVVVERKEISKPIPEKEISKKIKKELPKQSALGAIFNTIHQEVKQSEEVEKVDLDTQNVLLLWKTFLNENKDKLQNAFYSVAEKQKPEWIEGQVTFTETNNISLELLQLHKTDIVRYFMTNSTSVTVQLNFVLDRKEDDIKYYQTPKDRLKDMIENNPSVLKLIEKFDLNID